MFWTFLCKYFLMSIQFLMKVQLGSDFKDQNVANETLDTKVREHVNF